MVRFPDETMDVNATRSGTTLEHVLRLPPGQSVIRLELRESAAGRTAVPLRVDAGLRDAGFWPFEAR